MALGTLDDLGHVNVQIWDGETWGNLLEVTTLIGATNNIYRGFDMAYEQSSGDLVVAYYNGTTGQISYRRWNGAWQAAQTYNAPLTGVIYWIKMAALPGTDNIVIGMVNATPRTMAAIWDGATNTFGNGSALGAIASVVQAGGLAKFDVAYERSSGNPVIVYADTDNTSMDLEFWRYSGGAWAKPASQPNDADGGVMAVIRIASCAGTNYIGVINLDAGKDIDVHTWNGTTALWTTGLEGGVAGCGAGGGECEVTAASDLATSELLDIAFEQTSCEGLAVYGENVDAPRYRIWNAATGWGAELSALDPDSVSLGDPRIFNLTPKTGSDEIMMMVVNDLSTLGGLRWSGAAWNQINAGAAMEATAGSAVYRGFDFDYHWPPTVTVGKAGTQTGYVRAAETDMRIGTFTLSTPGTKYGKITQIIVSETGTIAANTKLSDVRLYVDDDGTWNGGGDETLISGPTTFSAGQTVTFAGLNLWTNTPIYLYVEADLAGGVTGETIQYAISAPGATNVTSPNAYITGPAVTFDAKTVDADAPTFNVTDGANPAWNTSDTITVTVSDTGGSGVGATTYWGYSADATCDGADTYPSTGLTTTVNTTHTDYVCFRNTDGVGNIGYSAAIGPLMVDTYAPTVTIEDPAAGSWQIADFIAVVTNADTGGSGLYQCFYRVLSNGVETVPSTSYGCAIVPSITVGAVQNCRDQGENKCRVEFYNTDAAGNTSTTQPREFSIDWTAPTVTIVGPAEWSWQRANFVADVTNADTGGSGLNVCRYRVASNGTYYLGWTAYDCAMDPPTITVGAAQNCRDQGVNMCQVEFYDTDIAGNNSTIEPRLFSIDWTAPTVTINSPAPGSWQGSAGFTADVTNADTGGSGLNVCYYRVASNGTYYLGWTPYACATEDPAITVGVGMNCRDEGANKCQVEFYDTDFAGNASTIATRQFSITFGAITPVTPSWIFDEPGATEFYGSGAPATAFGVKVLYIGNNNGKLYAVRISDGVKMWEYNVGSAIRSTPYFRDYVLYFGAENGTLYAVRDNGASPSLEWSVAVSPGFPIRTSVVRWLNGAEGRLYFGSNDGYLYCRQAATPGNVCADWAPPDLGSAIYSTPAIPGDGYVYVGTSGGIIAKVDRSTGGVPTSYTGYTGVYSAPFVYPQPIAGSWLWIGAYSNAVYKIDTTQLDGAEKIWPSFSPSSAGDFQGGVFVDVWRGGAWGSKTVYAGNDNGCLYAITDAGAQKWKYPAGADSLSLPIASCPMLDPNTDKIYFGADDGNIYALLDDPVAPTLISGWPFSTGDMIKACPSMSPGPGGYVMIPSTDGKVYAFPR